MRSIRPTRLRTRLTLLTAAAVAAAIAVSAAACWFIVRGELRGQLDASLTATALPRPELVCLEPPETAGLRSYLVTLQIVRADGASCVAPGVPPVVLTPGDVAIAQGAAAGLLRDGETADGIRMRVYTRYVGGGTALLRARPLSEIEQPLRRLALLLTLVAAVGVLGAASAGLLIARTSLVPVNRLTGAAEHIARTEDLTIRIPLRGDDEIARLGAAFNAMTAALASSRDRQQRLIADAGHELRTPLTSLRTNIDLLLRSERTGRPLPEGDRARLLGDVKAQLTELSSLVGDLLELSRPDRARDAAQWGRVALHEVVARAVERVRLRAPAVPVETELDPWYVRGDPAWLERAVVNLCDNAVKFSPPGEPVEVALRGGVLTVRDRGPGIPAQELPHVFDRFWRSPGARSLPGSGLGLSIVARVIHAHGGTVTLEPAPDGGTIARLGLPGTAE